MRATPIDLYDGPAPGSESWTGVERQYFSELWDTEVVTNVSAPTLVPVPPTAAGHGDGTAVIVAPGGGFHGLSIDSEGFAVADRLAAAGFTVFVLKYRLVQGGDDTVAELVHKTTTDLSGALDDMTAVAPLAGADGEAAVRLVRSRADEFSVDRSKVGFMGFSAGGNVAVRVAYSPDPAARPDFVAPIYATTRGIDVSEPPAGSGPMFLTVASSGRRHRHERGGADVRDDLGVPQLAEVLALDSRPALAARRRPVVQIDRRCSHPRSLPDPMPRRRVGRSAAVSPGDAASSLTPVVSPVVNPVGGAPRSRRSAGPRPRLAPPQDGTPPTDRWRSARR
jgi:acetyl esterase/lipase